ncbi:hypothetical protein BD770DRAFT_432773 [Pilaira anomala]|nr:hypothetical protein BD770DRAFT_432773 [Pilaira anomala]
MGKVSKVPCYCKACVNGIESGFNFVSLSTRNQHEKNDQTALPTRLEKILSTGIPIEEIISFNNSVEAEPVVEQLPMENDQIFEEIDVCHIDEFEVIDDTNIELQAELNNANDVEEEEEEEEEEELPQAQEARNPSVFPSEPIACIFVMMLMMMNGKYLTKEGCEPNFKMCNNFKKHSQKVNVGQYFLPTLTFWECFLLFENVLKLLTPDIVGQRIVTALITAILVLKKQEEELLRQEELLQQRVRHFAPFALANYARIMLDQQNFLLHSTFFFDIPSLFEAMPFLITGTRTVVRVETPSDVCKTIVAACILHNICIDDDDNFFDANIDNDDEDDEDDVYEDEFTYEGASFSIGRTHRNRLNRWFSELL